MMILLQNMWQRLKKIHKKHVARELIIRAIENTQNKDQGEEDVELFCCCQTPPYDDSKPYFGCDDVHWNYKSIYFTCAKVKKDKERSTTVLQIFEKKKKRKVNKTLSS